jgi:hypothetical protein
MTGGPVIDRNSDEPAKPSPIQRGTEGSNPFRSSGESAAISVQNCEHSWRLRPSENIRAGYVSGRSCLVVRIKQMIHVAVLGTAACLSLTESN